jgi:hypothetical protein
LEKVAGFDWKPRLESPESAVLSEDPNLTATPYEAVRAGQFDEVARAARAYVDACED